MRVHIQDSTPKFEKAPIGSEGLNPGTLDLGLLFLVDERQVGLIEGTKTPTYWFLVENMGIYYKGIL